MKYTNSMAEHARAFVLAFETLDDSMYQIVFEGGMRFKVPIVERIHISSAALTCIAFAAEIAIKAVAVHSADGDIAACPRGHRLDELYRKIPEDLRLSIAKDLGKSPAEVEQKLEKDANAFEQWRYAYEKGATADEVFLRAFTKAALSILPSS